MSNFLAKKWRKAIGNISKRGENTFRIYTVVDYSYSSFSFYYNDKSDARNKPGFFVFLMGPEEFKDTYAKKFFAKTLKK